MKDCRKVLGALVLALAFATSASAGIMHTDGSPAPAPTPTANGEIQHPVTADGEMQTGKPTLAQEATDAITEATLTLLQGLLALI